MKRLVYIYSFREYPFEYICKQVSQQGWDGLEVYPPFFDANQVETSLPALKKAAANHGLILGGAVCFLNPWNPPEEKLREIRNARRMIEVMGRLGIRHLNTMAAVLIRDKARPMDFGVNGSAMAREEDFDLAADAYRELAVCAKNSGVMLHLEMHGNTVHDNARSCLKLLSRIDHPSVSITFDPANLRILPHGENVYEAAEMLKGKIGHVHLKNVLTIGPYFSNAVSLKQGEIDFCRWVEKVFANGYLGDVCVEYTGDGDPVPVLADDLRYLNQLLKQKTKKNNKA